MLTFEIEPVLYISAIENSILPSFSHSPDPSPRLVMKILVKLCALLCMIAVFVEGCTFSKIV